MTRLPTCPNGELRANNPNCEKKNFVDQLITGHDTYIILIAVFFISILILFFVKKMARR